MLIYTSALMLMLGDCSFIRCDAACVVFPLVRAHAHAENTGGGGGGGVAAIRLRAR